MVRIGILLAVLCIALFLGGRWITGPHGHSAHPTASVRTPDNSNYYMKHATIYQLSPQGTLAYRMQAAQMLHFADDSSRLTDIDVHYLSGTKTYWNMHADKGHIPAGRHEMYVSDGVVLHHPQVNGNMITVTTPHAWIRPRANRVDSDARAVALEPGRKVTGNGMRINLKTNKLNLLHNVHVSYHP